MVALEKGFPLDAGRISPTPPVCSLAASRTASAGVLKGTLWGLPVLVRVIDSQLTKLRTDPG